MKKSIKNGDTVLMLAAGTELKLGAVTVSVKEATEFTLKGERSYQEVLEIIASSGQIKLNADAFVREIEEDGKKYTVRYNGNGVEVDRDEIVAKKRTRKKS